MRPMKDDQKQHQNYFQIDQNRQVLDEEDVQMLWHEDVVLISNLIRKKRCTIKEN
jgi:hypothetical protein